MSTTLRQVEPSSLQSAEAILRTLAIAQAHIRAIAARSLSFEDALRVELGAPIGPASGARGVDEGHPTATVVDPVPDVFATEAAFDAPTGRAFPGLDDTEAIRIPRRASTEVPPPELPLSPAESPADAARPSLVLRPPAPTPYTEDPEEETFVARAEDLAAAHAAALAATEASSAQHAPEELRPTDEMAAGPSLARPADPFPPEPESLPPTPLQAELDDQTARPASDPLPAEPEAETPAPTSPLHPHADDLHPEAPAPTWQAFSHSGLVDDDEQTLLMDGAALAAALDQRPAPAIDEEDTAERVDRAWRKQVFEADTIEQRPSEEESLILNPAPRAPVLNLAATTEPFGSADQFDTDTTTSLAPAPEADEAEATDDADEDAEAADEAAADDAAADDEAQSFEEGGPPADLDPDAVFDVARDTWSDGEDPLAEGAAEAEEAADSPDAAFDQPFSENIAEGMENTADEGTVDDGSTPQVAAPLEESTAALDPEAEDALADSEGSAWDAEEEFERPALWRDETPEADSEEEPDSEEQDQDEPASEDLSTDFPPQPRLVVDEGATLPVAGNEPADRFRKADFRAEMGLPAEPESADLAGAPFGEPEQDSAATLPIRPLARTPEPEPDSESGPLDRADTDVGRTTPPVRPALANREEETGTARVRPAPRRAEDTGTARVAANTRTSRFSNTEQPSRPINPTPSASYGSPDGGPRVLDTGGLRSEPLGAAAIQILGIGKARTVTPTLELDGEAPSGPIRWDGEEEEGDLEVKFEEPSADRRVHVPQLTEDTPPPLAGGLHNLAGSVSSRSGLSTAERTRFITLAQEAERKGKLQDAVLAWSDLIDFDAECLEAWLGRGRCLVDLGDHSAAMSDFTRAEAISPRKALAITEMGHLHFARKEYARAIEYYDQAIGLEPNLPMALAQRGMSHLHRKDYSAAIADLTKAEAADPSIPGIARQIQQAKKRGGK